MGHSYIKDYYVRVFLVESGKDLGPVPNATKRMAVLHHDAPHDRAQIGVVVGEHDLHARAALPPHIPRGTRALSPLAAAVPRRPQSNRCAAVRLRRRHHAGLLQADVAIARTAALRSRPV